MVSLENHPTQQRQTEEIENNKASTSKPSISSTSVHDNSSSCSLFKSFFFLRVIASKLQHSYLSALLAPFSLLLVPSLLFSSVLVSRFSDCRTEHAPVVNCRQSVLSILLEVCTSFSSSIAFSFYYRERSICLLWYYIDSSSLSRRCYSVEARKEFPSRRKKS